MRLPEFICIMSILVFVYLIPSNIFNNGVDKLGIEILNNQNKILTELTEIVELSKKYPVYEINLSKKSKTKIKKIKKK